MIAHPQSCENKRKFGWYQVEESGWALKTGVYAIDSQGQM